MHAPYADAIFTSSETGVNYQKQLVGWVKF